MICLDCFDSTGVTPALTGQVGVVREGLSVLNCFGTSSYLPFKRWTRKATLPAVFGGAVQTIVFIAETCRVECGRALELNHDAAASSCSRKLCPLNPSVVLQQTVYAVI